jgi:hypothetical protein
MKGKLLLMMILVVFFLLAAQTSATQKTLMGFQGKATNSSGAAITGGNITINVSAGTNCLGEIFNRTYINNFTRDGIFDIMLGEYDDLELDFNKDYYICISIQSSQAGTSAKEQVGGPYKFRGGQGQIGFEDLSFNYTNNTIWFGGHLPSYYASASDGIVISEITAFVNRTGDTMTGDLNISIGTGFVNVSAVSGALNLTGNITGQAWNLLRVPWSFLRDVPTLGGGISNAMVAAFMNRTGDYMPGALNLSDIYLNRTFRAYSGSEFVNITASTGVVAATGNMTANSFLGQLYWNNLTGVPDWVANNYTSWNVLGEVPHHLSANYTNNSIYFGSHVPSYYTNHFGLNYTNRSLYLGQHSASWYEFGWNYTGKAMSVQANSIDFTALAQNYTGKAMGLQDGINFSGTLFWGNLTSVPDWVANNYTTWNVLGEVPHHISNNYTAKAITIQDGINFSGTLFWGNLTSIPLWVAGNYTAWSNIGSIPVNVYSTCDSNNCSGILYTANQSSINTSYSNPSIIYDANYTASSGWNPGYVVESTFVNVTGDEMTGDLNFTSGTGYVNISATGSINMSSILRIILGKDFVNLTSGGNIFWSGVIAGDVGWGNLTNVPDNIANNYTGWAQIGEKPMEATANYTSKAMGLQDGINFSGTLFWGNLTSVPLWVAGNYTGWSNIGEIPDWVANNYTSWNVLGEVPHHLSNNYTNNTIWFGGHLPSYYLDGAGGITDAIVAAFVNITGDEMTGDLNTSAIILSNNAIRVYQGVEYVNITGGNVTASGVIQASSFLGDIAWGNISGAPMEATANYTGKAMGLQDGINFSGTLFWGNLTSVPLWVAGNYTSWNTLGERPDNLVNNYTGWATIGEIPDWVANNYTSWNVLGEVPNHLSSNYTAKAMSLQDGTNFSGTLFWGNLTSIPMEATANYTNDTVWFGGHLPSYYLDGAGGITDAIVAAFVNITGDEMTGDLNLTRGSGSVNISASGFINASDNVSANWFTSRIDCSNIRQDGGGSDSDFCNDGGGSGISNAIVAAFVNITGDEMTGDLNLTRGSGFVNLSASGDVEMTGNLTVNSTMFVSGALGRVGINTTNPGRTFDTNGTMRATGFDGSGSVGKGTEIDFDTTNSIGRIFAYDRSSSAWLDTAVGLSGAFVVKADGSIGIGTTTPSYLLEINNDTSGNVLNVSNRLLVNSSTTRLTINGLYYQRPVADVAAVFGITDSGGTNRIRFDVDGTDGRFLLRRDDNVYTVTLDSDGNSHLTGGNVGINTTTPRTTLEIVSKAVFNLSSTIAGQDNIFLQDGSGAAGNDNYGASIGFDKLSAGSTGRRAVIAMLQTNNDADIGGLAFFTHNATTASDLIEAMRIEGSGDVGIGTKTPDNRLTIQDDHSSAYNTDQSVSTNTVLHLRNTDNAANFTGLGFRTRTSNQAIGLIGLEWQSNSDGDFFFRLRDGPTTSKEVLRLEHGGDVIIPSGNMGIGDSSPSEALEVEGNISLGDDAVNRSFILDEGDLYIQGKKMGGLNYDMLFFTDNTPISATEKMRLTAAGSLGIGISRTKALLHVDGNANISTDLTVQGTIMDGYNIFYGYTTAAGGVLTAAGEQKAVNLTTEVADDSFFSHGSIPDNTNITINQDGRYMVSWAVNIDVTSGTARSTAQCWLDRNGDEVTYYNATSYHRIAGGGDQVNAKTGLICLNNGDVIQVACDLLTGTDTLRLEAGSSVYVEYKGSC